MNRWVVLVGAAAAGARWAAAAAPCVVCATSWMSVAPEGTERLQCPAGGGVTWRKTREGN